MPVARSGALYYRPAPTGDLALMRAIDEQYLKTPFATHGRHAETLGVCHQSQGATTDAVDGDRGDRLETKYEQEESGTRDLPISVA